MKRFLWDPQKNDLLKRLRGVTFEDLLDARSIVVIDHYSRAHQKMILVEYKGYVWAIPCIDNGDHYFLKTAFPNRKYTRQYLGR